ncbi:MAG: hypothetical protein KF681_16035 [Bdellovibrionaceae bacterium]|nr:hypothetical protein [Pseudobdellovibrionaceae bacterium]
MKQNNKVSPDQPYFWMRLGLMLLALIGIVWAMGYFQSGEFESSPNVQGMMNPDGEGVERKARVVIEAPPSASPTPTGSANGR